MNNRKDTRIKIITKAKQFKFSDIPKNSYFVNEDFPESIYLKFDENRAICISEGSTIDYSDSKNREIAQYNVINFMDIKVMFIPDFNENLDRETQ